MAAFRMTLNPFAPLRATNWSKQPSGRTRHEWVAAALDSTRVQAMQAADERLLGYAIG